MKNTDRTTEIHRRLRIWAGGSFTDEAGVELLIRGFDGRFAMDGKPWIRHERNHAGEETAWVDWDIIPDYIGALSGGEYRYLMLTASLAGGCEVRLKAFAALDHREQDLVLSAMRHAGGRRFWPFEG